jgi:hypothetical protein
MIYGCQGNFLRLAEFVQREVANNVTFCKRELSFCTFQKDESIRGYQMKLMSIIARGEGIRRKTYTCVV